MKLTISHLFCITFALVLSITGYAAPERYQFDPSHTTVLWHINHFGFSNPSGKWQAEGTLLIDEEKPQDSQIKATIDVASLSTGIPKLDEHLKGQDFFDVAQYKTATFESKKITMTGKTTADVQGTLTIHGVTKPITLKVTLNKLGMSPITNKKTAGFTATTEINRSDFGMKAYLPGLGDKVKIDIEAEAYKI